MIESDLVSRAHRVTESDYVLLCHEAHRICDGLLAQSKYEPTRQQWGTVLVVRRTRCEPFVVWSFNNESGRPYFFDGFYTEDALDAIHDYRARK